MITKPQSIQKLKEIFIETFFDHTTNVSKISSGSVVNGIAYGCAEIGKRAIKDIALIEGHLFPDAASGPMLDKVADLYGISPRFTASESSGYVRVVGDPNTQYLQGIHEFISSEGVTFGLEQDVTIGDDGFVYAHIRSQVTGEAANVNSMSINRVNPVPTGHEYVVNEYRMTGGRDEEDDEELRKRIKDGANILATGTLARLEQVFIKINQNVLRIFHQGLNQNGQIIIAVASKNGIDFTVQEFDEIIERSVKFLALTEYRSWGNLYNSIELRNVTYYPVDISMRVELQPSTLVDDVRKRIQIGIGKYFDTRYWKPDQNVEWDDLLQIAKEVQGIKTVYDKFFFPQVDIDLPKNQLPRVRGFLMLDANGNLISDGSGNLNPLYYPNIADFSLITTTLSSI